jgi:hypothetical protein
VQVCIGLMNWGYVCVCAGFIMRHILWFILSSDGPAVILYSNKTMEYAIFIHF